MHIALFFKLIKFIIFMNFIILSNSSLLFYHSFIILLFYQIIFIKYCQIFHRNIKILTC